MSALEELRALRGRLLKEREEHVSAIAEIDVVLGKQWRERRYAQSNPLRGTRGLAARIATYVDESGPIHYRDIARALGVDRANSVASMCARLAKFGRIRRVECGVYGKRGEL